MTNVEVSRITASDLTRATEEVLNEKLILVEEAETAEESENPVVSGSQYVYDNINIVRLNLPGVKEAARHIHHRLLAESYSPRTWRTHPLHICPIDEPAPSSSSDSELSLFSRNAEETSPTDGAREKWNKTVLDWIFLISSLNFSFWSELEGTPDRYGVEWRESWTSQKRKTFTGYWSLVAALNRAMDDDSTPITDPTLYSSEILCPDSLIAHVFRPAAQCKEIIPLLAERISIMRENGFILCHSFGGSFHGLLTEFHRRHDGEGAALDLVKMVVETFPSFRDEHVFEGRKVCIWKRAQIFVAEAWAAFYPPSAEMRHPLFPGKRGACIEQLTMFADYRVPQILHHLGILTYPPQLVQLLREHAYLEGGSKEELSLRAASVLAVERVCEEILALRAGQLGQSVGSEDVEDQCPDKKGMRDTVCSVVVDMFLWDVAKRVESGDEKVEGIQTQAILPAHRTRSIWY